MHATSIKNAGFTLTEALVASALSVLATAMVLTLLVRNLDLWRTGMARIQLDDQSRILRERVLHGLDGQFGLRHARRSQITSTTDQIVFFDIANSNALSLLWPSNQAPLYMDQSGIRPLARGVFVEKFTATATGNFLNIDCVLAVTGRHAIHSQPQQIRVYLLNE